MLKLIENVNSPLNPFNGAGGGKNRSRDADDGLKVM